VPGKERFVNSTHTKIGIQAASSPPSSNGKSTLLPAYPPRRRIWNWLVNRVPFLRKRFTHVCDLAPMPARDEAFETKLLVAICEPETRSAVLLILQGEELAAGPDGDADAKGGGA
jgi:hypothetical protein